MEIAFAIAAPFALGLAVGAWGVYLLFKGINLNLS